MSAPAARRTLTAAGLTLAVVLSTPLAALAGASDAERDGEPGQRGSSSSSPGANGSSGPASGASGTSGSGAEDEQARPDREAESQEAESREADRRPAGSGTSEPRRETPRRKQSRPTGADQPANGDPRGNNGTIKVDGVAFDDGKGNEPHVGCDLRLVFWGFDADDRATITFTGQAPTGGGLLHTETGTLISDDAAGGGQDRDAALVYSVSDELSELLAVAPHPQQGWHVKVEVDVEGAPGGAKQKVLWIDCPQAPSAVEGATEQAADAGDTTVTTAGAPSAPVPAPGTAAETGAAAAPADSDVLSAELVAEDAAAAAAGTTGTTEAAATAGEGAVAARAAARPSALPFTGPTAVGLLAAIGIGSLLAGGAAHRLGRRREVLA